MKLKQIFNSILDEFVYGGHLISLGAVGIVLTSAISLNIKITWDFLILVFLFTYTSILYNRFREHQIDYLTNPERTKNLEKYFRYIFLIVLFSILIFVGTLLYYNKMLVLVFIISLFLLCFLYTEYFKRITKEIIAFKNIYFSLVTSLLVIFLALYYSYPLLDSPLFLISLFVFLQMFVNTIFLDIKDIESDKKVGLLTLPIVLNRKKILLFLKITTIFSVVPIIFGVYLKLFPAYLLMLLFVIPYTFFYLKKSDKKINFYLVNYILADLNFILWPFFILIGKLLLGLRHYDRFLFS